MKNLAEILEKYWWRSSYLLKSELAVNNFTMDVTMQKQPFADVLQNRCLRNFTMLRGKHLCLSLFLIKLQTWSLQHRCFPVNIVKFLRTVFLQNTSGGCFWLWIFCENFRFTVFQKPSPPTLSNWFTTDLIISPANITLTKKKLKQNWGPFGNSQN